MSLQSPLTSLQSVLGSFVSNVNRLSFSSSSPAKRPIPFNPLFDFVQVASASGLKQYNQEIAEEGLVAANLGDGVDYVVDKVRSTNGEIVVVKHVKAILPTETTAHEVGSDEKLRIRKVLHEIKIVTHPALKENVNILHIKGFGWELAEGSLTTPFLVVEYAEYGTLRDYLKSESHAVAIETKCELALHAARGLQSLHAHRIAHGDLKPENALVSAMPHNPTLKITDFGQSVFLDSDEKSYEYWGTKWYRPPEVSEQTEYSETAGLIAGSRYRACDIYAYGLLVLEILVDGEQYFDGAGEQTGTEDGSEPLHRLLEVDSKNNPILLALKHIVQECLQIEAEARPRIDEVIFQLRGSERAVEEDDVAPLTILGLASSENTGSIINLNQFCAALVGRELENGSAHLAPWNVQQLIAEGFSERSRCPDPAIAAQACLQFAICQYVGFGVERNQEKVLENIDLAAAYGCFQARRIRHRLYGAFSRPIRPLDIMVEVDDIEQRQLQRLLAAEMQRLDVNPFQLFDEVVQEDFQSRSSGMALSLHQAAYAGDLGRIRELLDNESDFQDEQGRTALFLAVQGRRLDAMKLLLEFGSSDPHLADEDGHTPIHMLIMFSSAEVDAALALMLQSPRELDLNCFSPTPLDASEHWGELWGAPVHWAVLAGNKAMTSCLVKAGARVHDWPEDTCPIRIAASLHLFEVLEILLSAIPNEVALLGSNPLFALNSSNPFRRLLLHGNNYISAIEKTVALLTKRYPIVDKEEEVWNGNPLRKILVTNSSDSDHCIAKALIAGGAANDRYRGLTLLQSAIIGCHGSPVPSVCSMALEMIDIEGNLRQRCTEYRQGWTALHWAAAGGLVSVAEKLLQADPESINLRTEEPEERTPLHLAAEHGRSIDMIRLLLGHGADASSTTRDLKLTPLGSFVSNQRSELNVAILTTLLHASKITDYVIFSADQWNILHFSATRAALLDIESLPGHLLLRELATVPDVKALISSTTAQGWTPLHLASYMVDYSTIKLLVEDFNADVQVSTPNGARPFDILLERARQFPDGLRGADSLARWTRVSFRSALFLQKQLEVLEGPLRLTPLHIAAYIGYESEVERIVRKHPDAVFETNGEGETPRQMLLNTMQTNATEQWAVRFQNIGQSVCKYLEETEMKLEEELERSWINDHSSQS